MKKTLLLLAAVILGSYANAQIPMTSDYNFLRNVSMERDSFMYGTGANWQIDTGCLYIDSTIHRVFWDECPVSEIVNDSVLVNYVRGHEISRDTIPLGGSNFTDSTRLARDSVLIYWLNGVKQDSATIRTADKFYFRDSTRLSNDSVLTYYFNGAEIGKDTVRVDKYWSNSGNYTYNVDDSIGIGTDTPSAKLEVTEDVIVNGKTLGIGSSGVQTNTAFGDDVLQSAAASSSENTAVGYQAMRSTIGADYNTAVGHQSLQFITGGQQNNAFGNRALRSLTDGTGNSAIGYEALGDVTTGDYNVAIGHFAAFDLTGSNNTAIGRFTLSGLSPSGSNNTGIGYSVAGNFGNGSNNTLIGSDGTANSLRHGNYNIIIGGGNTGDDIQDSSYNTIIGGQLSTLGEIGSTVILADGRASYRFYSAEDSSTCILCETPTTDIDLNGEVHSRKKVTANAGYADTIRSNGFDLPVADYQLYTVVVDTDSVNINIDTALLKLSHGFDFSLTVVVDTNRTAPKVTFTSGKFQLPGGSAPTLTTTNTDATRKDILTFRYDGAPVKRLKVIGINDFQNN